MPRTLLSAGPNAAMCLQLYNDNAIPPTANGWAAGLYNDNGAVTLTELANVANG